jgi:hypothetical protein
MFDLALIIIWLACALPVAMLLGYCTLSVWSETLRVI